MRVDAFGRHLDADDVVSPARCVPWRRGCRSARCSPASSRPCRTPTCRLQPAACARRRPALPAVARPRAELQSDGLVLVLALERLALGSGTPADRLSSSPFDHLVELRRRGVGVLRAAIQSANQSGRNRTNVATSSSTTSHQRHLMRNQAIVAAANSSDATVDADGDQQRLTPAMDVDQQQRRIEDPDERQHHGAHRVHRTLYADLDRIFLCDRRAGESLRDRPAA